MFAPSHGGTVRMINSNSLPGWLVLSWAAKRRLLLSGLETVSGSSRLLTMRTVVALDGDSEFTMITAICGVTSTGRQMLHLIWRFTVGCVGSLQVTVIDFSTGPL